MSMLDKVSVNTHYTRSINLERDASSLNVVKAYIPTSRALRTLTKISNTFNEEQFPRAWSLVGPYGSGKSSFSVFLSQLLSNPSDVVTKEAFKVLRNTDADITKPFASYSKGSEGLLKILVTGAPEPMGARIVRGMADAANNFWEGKKCKKPAIIAKLNRAQKRNDLSTTEIIDLVCELQKSLSKIDCRGIILVIDELGKFLEYEARHYGANDIYLLQAIAEYACKGNSTNLYVFALLHQSFEQYAKGLGESLKNEWSKVQGRFEEIPFLESSEQVLRVVSAALNQELSDKESKLLISQTRAVVDILHEQEALPSALSKKEAVELLSNCYPLHPVSAILLPLLCQKVAQNERTMFSYLGSHEECGLLDMIGRLANISDYVLPHHIFDYFIANQPAVMGDHQTHRRWAEVVTAIERLGDSKEDDLNLLKTIGILNIVGSKGGFKASKSLLEACMPGPSVFTKSVKALQKKSVTTYRRYNSEYRVWQGSDFDLEEALREEINNLGNFSLAEQLNSAKSLLPIVARRYTVKNGALRFFSPIFVDAKNYKSTPQEGDDPRIIFYLAAGQDDEKFYYNRVVKHFSDLDIVALCLCGLQLRDAVTETQALKRVEITKQELNSDPVAKREFEDRLTAAEQAEMTLLQDLIDSPSNSLWHYKSIDQNVRSKRELQEVMSSVLEEVYHKAPVFHNELINRDKPSSQANAARNKLLYAMLNHEGDGDLNIDKFPPEKAIYRSLLKATGLHKENEAGQFSFVEPDSDKRKLSKREKESNIGPVWEKICEFLDTTEKEARSLVELNTTLMSPPYGVKAGTLPILYIAVYIVHQHELALYENRRYRPYFTEEILERFVKRPDEFEFQCFKIQGLKASIFDQYSKVIHGDTEKRTLLELAKPLATFMDRLPEYTQKTRRGMGPIAQSVRSAFNLAKSPERLLFQELPKALGFSDLNNKASAKDLAEFAQLLTETLRELRDAYSNLIANQKRLLAQAFNISPNIETAELRKILAGKCHGLENYTVDTQGLRAFIMRLTQSSGEDSDWLENVLMFLGHKPSKKWLDSDHDTAEHRLNDFARRVIDLETLSVYEQKRAHYIDEDFDVYLLRSVKKGGMFKDEVVAVDKKSRSVLQGAREAMKELLGRLDNKELKLALLAETIDEFLEQHATKGDENVESISASKKNRKKRTKLKLNKGK